MDSSKQANPDGGEEMDTARVQGREGRITPLLKSLVTEWDQVHHDLSEFALAVTKAHTTLETSTSNIITYLNTLELDDLPSNDKVGRTYWYSWQLYLSRSLVLTHTQFPHQPTSGFGLVLTPLAANIPEVKVADSEKENMCTCGARPNLYWLRGPSVVVCNICRQANSDLQSLHLQWPMLPDVRQTQELKDNRKPPKIVVVLEFDWALANNRFLQNFISTSDHPDTHLITYSSTGNTFLSQQLHPHTDVNS